MNNRRQSRDNEGSYYTDQPKGARFVIGILMVLLYFGVALLLFFKVLNVFNYPISCVVGGLLCAYGVFRGYLLYRNGQ